MNAAGCLFEKVHDTIGKTKDGKERNMNVYFDENYWGCLEDKAHGTPGREFRCLVSFQWEGRECRIPAVYLFEQGLTADLCCRIERQELLDFYKKWEERESEEEELLLQQKNPFYMDIWMEIEADGVPLQRQTGCGCSYQPLDLMPPETAQNAEADAAEEMLMEAYGLDRTAGWTFWRQSFAWAEGKPGEQSALAVALCREPEDLPGPHFRTGTKKGEREIEFVHPATGKVHKLTVLEQEAGVLPVREFPPETGIRQFPEHFTILHYQVEPELPEGALLVSDCARPDSPVKEADGPAASSIAVIGGADGPTSIFLAGKVSAEEGGPSRRKAYSALHYEPAEEVEWRLTFRSEEDRKIRVNFHI